MSNAVWTGSITFGLVNIRMRPHQAVRSKDVRFHLLSEDDRTRVRRRFVSMADETEVSQEELVRSFEMAPDQYVVIEDEEFEASLSEARRRKKLA